MKKIIIFLIALLTISFINIKDTYATSTFYQGEYVPGIWLNKYNSSDNLIYYHQARIIRDQTTNQIAYCLEPFTELTQEDSYQETQTPTNFTNSQIEDLTLIAHFGYGYNNHTDPKWYAITQMLIWKMVNPTTKLYYTSSANGEKITFTNEEQEIYDLIEEYKKDTSFNNQTYTIVTNNRISKTDFNNVLHTYKTTDPSIEIIDNIIYTPILTTGTYEITLEKENIVYNQPILFYQSATNQDVIKLGDPPKKINKFKINVIETEVTINKIDYDTKTNIPQGNASLENTILSLYSNKNVFIQDIKLDKTGTAGIKNLNFGTYYIKEKTPGTGYTLNTDKYSFTLNETTPTKTITIPNKVITGKLKIIKKYGNKDTFEPEPNISFNIYNNQELIKTIITDEFGIAELTLPYGEYTITQLTTTEGYQKVEPISFEINEQDQLIELNLKNYKIDVPNTSSKSLLTKIIEFIKDLLC